MGESFLLILKKKSFQGETNAFLFIILSVHSHLFISFVGGAEIAGKLKKKKR